MWGAIFVTFTLGTLSSVNANKRFPIAATCVLNNSDIQGVIYLRQEEPSSDVIITGEVSGLSPGLHGFHVHEYGDISEGCASSGVHFNPFNRDHGAPSDENRHLGDLGNIEANSDGVANIDTSDSQISFKGRNSILGRVMVVHVGEDDLGRGGNDESKKTGNAGPPQGCCIIGLAKS